MPATTLRVELLDMTPEAEGLIYTAAKRCTSSDDAERIYDDAIERSPNIDNIWVHTKIPYKEQAGLIRRVLASGHDSVVEHVSFTFAVAGVSRALSHQLVRHRIASYSQQSQRYVKADGFDYVKPESIRPLDSKHIRIPVPGGGIECLNANAIFKEAMDCCQLAYNRLTELGIPAEDARYVLPNACETKLVVTMNCRSLLHFFELRCCNRAQWEIRALANAMLGICKDRLPIVFEKAGARCKRLGYCPEAKQCREHMEKEAAKAADGE